LSELKTNDEVMQLKPSELAPFIIYLHSSGVYGKVPYVMGGIGLGKSAIVRQVVEYMRTVGGKPNYGYVEFRTATQEPTDVTGVPMPNTEKGWTEFLKPKRLKELPEDWEGIVFLDEFTKAPLSVTNAWSQPLLERFIDEFQLPKGLRFVIAGNRRIDKSSDTDLGMFIYNRICQVELVPDVDDTVIHFKKIGVRDDLCAFLKFGGTEHLWNYNPDKKVNATPRTWEMVGDIVDQGERVNVPDILMQAGVIGYVGKGPGHAYLSFRKMLNTIPAVSEVITNPTGVRIFEDPSTAYALAMCLARKADATNMAAIMTYLNRGSVEMTAAFITDAAKRNPAVKETKAYITWATDNKDLELKA